VNTQAGYVRVWLRSALAKRTGALYDAGTMMRRIRFAYFYAYLGPARVRLGMS